MANPFEKELKELKANRQMVYLLVFLLLIAILWISAAVFTSYKTLEIDAELIKMSRPLIPNIDESVFSKIEQKKIFTEDELADFPIYKVVNPKEEEEQLKRIRFASLPETATLSARIATSGARLNY